MQFRNTKVRRLFTGLRKKGIQPIGLLGICILVFALLAWAFSNNLLGTSNKNTNTAAALPQPTDLIAWNIEILNQREANFVYQFEGLYKPGKTIFVSPNQTVRIHNFPEQIQGVIDLRQSSPDWLKNEGKIVPEDVNKSLLTAPNKPGTYLLKWVGQSS